jgi:hypothetical protein
MNRNGQAVAAVVTAQSLLGWGVEQVAYVRPTAVEDGVVYAVCSADGGEMGVFRDREVAFAACRQHDLEPLSVH